MISEFDIYRSAKILIEEHGDVAAYEAVMRADEMMADGDANGCAMWLRIFHAVDDLQRLKLNREESLQYLS